MPIWLPSYRSFRKAVGEITALSAGVEVAVRTTSELAATLGREDPWSELAKETGIRLDGIDSEQIKSSASRFGLVAVYSVFDSFVHELRSDWHDLSGREWQRHRGDSPFVEMRRNAPAEFSLGEQEIAIEYYRRCRNWIVHPSDATRDEAKAYWHDSATALSTIRTKWIDVGSLVAPSAPEILQFCDVKLFARLSLHSAQQLSGIFDPGDEAIARTLPLGLWPRLAHNPTRRLRAASGFLQTQWGLDRVRAERIARIAMTAT